MMPILGGGKPKIRGGGGISVFRKEKQKAGKSLMGLQSINKHQEEKAERFYLCRFSETTEPALYTW